MSPFTERKKKILSQLAVPDQDYTDLSPKGSVDEAIRTFVDEINLLEGYVTTSSCAGRIAVFLDGANKKDDAIIDEEDAISSASTKGGKGGGQWLYVSHSSLDLSSVQQEGELLNLFGIKTDDGVSVPSSDNRPRFVHFRFEPMVCLLCFLHIARHLSFHTLLAVVFRIPSLNFELACSLFFHSLIMVHTSVNRSSTS